MNSILSLFALLLGWHMLADYPLQGDFLARAKNHTAPLPGVPWGWALSAHTFIHAIGVLVLTHNWWAFGIELVAHTAIDYSKCAGRFGFSLDQSLHIATKVAIVALLWVLR